LPAQPAGDRGGPHHPTESHQSPPTVPFTHGLPSTVPLSGTAHCGRARTRRRVSSCGAALTHSWSALAAEAAGHNKCGESIILGAEAPHGGPRRGPDGAPPCVGLRRAIEPSPCAMARRPRLGDAYMYEPAQEAANDALTVRCAPLNGPLTQHALDHGANTVCAPGTACRGDNGSLALDDIVSLWRTRPAHATPAWRSILAYRDRSAHPEV